MQASFQTYTCGICGFESYSHDEVAKCAFSHTAEEMRTFYATGKRQRKEGGA